MINKDTPIGTLCKLNKGFEKHIVSYQGDGDANDTFSGILIESELFSTPIIVGKILNGFGRERFNAIETPLESKCNHEYVNVSFNQIKMACKFCGKDQ